MNPYMNCWSSCMNMIKRFVAENASYQLELFDFDANVLETEYPDGNLAGVYQMTYEERGPLIYVQCAFPLSVDSESDITKLREIAGKFALFVRNETKHPYYNYEGQNAVGLMVARDQLDVSPTVKTTNRQYLFVQQGFIVDRTATFQPT